MNRKAPGSPAALAAGSAIGVRSLFTLWSVVAMSGAPTPRDCPVSGLSVDDTTVVVGVGVGVAVDGFVTGAFFLASADAEDSEVPQPVSTSRLDMTPAPMTPRRLLLNMLIPTPQ
jgi:hypothetical protein